MRDLSKHHAVSNSSLLSHDHGRGFPLPEFDEGKQEQLDREKAQINRSLELLFRADSTDSSHVIAKSPSIPQPSRVTGKLEEIPRIKSCRRFVQAEKLNVDALSKRSLALGA
jgi:hypothetical protein